MRIELFFPALFPISTSQWSPPSQDQQSCRHWAHMCPPWTSSNMWIQECWVYTPGKGEGRGEKPAVSWVDSGRAWWMPAPPVWGRKVHAQLSLPFFSASSVPLHPCFLPEVRPASHREAWECVDLGWVLCLCLSHTAFNSQFCFSWSWIPLWNIREMLSGGSWAHGSLYLRSSGSRQQPQPPALRSSQ